MNISNEWSLDRQKVLEQNEFHAAKKKKKKRKRQVTRVRIPRDTHVFVRRFRSLDSRLEHLSLDW